MTTQAETAILAGCCFWDMYKKNGDRFMFQE